MPRLMIDGWHAGAVEIPRRSRRGKFVVIVTAATVAMMLVGCGGPAEPDRIGATGIDELTIPTPDPRAADFVDTIDNPFLPLTPGAVWVYASNRGTTLTVTVTVTNATKVIEGVPTTVVRDEIRNSYDEVVATTSRWLAQDRRGNVWNFGTDLSLEQGGWAAGTAGAQAGLAMAAVPRVGDGFRPGLLGGVAEDTTTVVALDGDGTVPAGDFDNLVVTEETSELRPGENDERWYAEGVGLIRWEFAEGGFMELVSHSPPTP